MKGKSSWPFRKGVLTIVAMLLLSSATLRVAIGATDALAQNTEARPNLPETPALTKCETPPDIAATLAALKQRDERLRTQENEMQQQTKALAAAKSDIEQKLAELVAAENALRNTMAIADSAAENDISALVAVYEAMKPKTAAALFEEMDAQFAAGFIRRMAPDAAAKIMAGLPPRSAYALSAILAGRNANIPTP